MSANTYYILTRDGVAREREIESFVVVVRSPPTCAALAGSLWQTSAASSSNATTTSEGDHGSNSLSLQSVDNEHLQLECPRMDVARLKDVEYGLLLALTTCRERLELYADGGRLSDVCDVVAAWNSTAESGGNRLVVDVIVDDDSSTPSSVPGTVKYVGQLPTTRRGIWFAVELDSVRIEFNLKPLWPGCMLVYNTI